LTLLEEQRLVNIQWSGCSVEWSIFSGVGVFAKVHQVAL